MAKQPTKREARILDLLRAAGAEVEHGDPLTMARQALGQVIPPQHRPPGEARRADELAATVALDGDRAANHLFHWTVAGAAWTPSTALAAIGFYRLPHDPANGLLEPDGLLTAIRTAVATPAGLEDPGTLADALRADATKELATRCRTDLTGYDAEMYAAYPGADLREWAARASKSRHARDITRWRHIAYVVTGTRAVGF